jgi:NAD(P)-dependent dehydrogenase (short-subunit alcohol dehydrogenase family)
LTRDLRLEDKVAIVTGGGRGIGRGIALRFAKEGADSLIFTRTIRYAEEVIDEIKSLGRKALTFQGDATRKHDCEAMVKAAVHEFGRIDILVNNVGGGETHSSFVDISEEDWDRIVDFNLKSQFLCAQPVVKQMIKQGKGGKIINISSYVAKTPLGPQPDYCAAKAGVIAFTQSLAKELAKYRINVNAICPGWIDTPGLRGWGKIHLEAYPKKAKNLDDLFQQLVKELNIPLGRMGTPKDIAGAAVFLASKDTDYMTGQAINMSGGLEMH